MGCTHCGSPFSRRLPDMTPWEALGYCDSECWASYMAETLRAGADVATVDLIHGMALMARELYTLRIDKEK